MSALKKIVEGGHSLAVATGLKATSHGTTNPEEFAMGEMSITERAQYDAWRNGVRLREFAKETSKAERKVFKGGDKSLDQWVQGLRLMYGDDTLTREHACWYAKNADFMAPTIMAHIKVVNAQRGLTVSDSDLTANELAEYQTARKIMAESSFAVQAKMKEIHALTSQVDAANQAALARIRYYEPRIKKKPHGPAPINKQRARLNLPLFGAPSNLSALGRHGKAVTRENLGQSRALKRQRVTAEVGDGGISPTYAPQSPTIDYGDLVAGDLSGMEGLEQL
jgi:hypothetical protein